MANPTVPNGGKTQNTTSAAQSQTSPLANQVAFLQDLISTPVSEEDATVNLATLLQQLDAADNVAKGVEGKLDDLLENLEGMLKGLEGNVGLSVDGEEARGDDKAESTSSHPKNRSTEAKASD